jgi:hypothetical protein
MASWLQIHRGSENAAMFVASRGEKQPQPLDRILEIDFLYGNKLKMVFSLTFTSPLIKNRPK